MSTQFDIVKINQTNDSFRVQKLIGMFELQKEHSNEHFVGSLELPEQWNIGCIVGMSGTGKSTIAKELYSVFQTSYSDKAIIDEMPQNKSVEEITKTFTSVGLSSPPSWLKPYSVLSNGEKMRVDLAKAILSDEEVIVFDEFTSVVDRDVASVVSSVVQKIIRKQNRKFIAVTCHYDVLDWLQADWVFSTDEMKTIDSVKKNETLRSKSTSQILQRGDCLLSITI